VIFPISRFGLTRCADSGPASRATPDLLPFEDDLRRCDRLRSWLLVSVILRVFAAGFQNTHMAMASPFPVKCSVSRETSMTDSGDLRASITIHRRRSPGERESVLDSLAETAGARARLDLKRDITPFDAERRAVEPLRRSWRRRPPTRRAFAVSQRELGVGAWRQAARPRPGESTEIRHRALDSGGINFDRAVLPHDGLNAGHLS